MENVSLGRCKWAEKAKLYNYWAALRAFVTDEDAHRDALKGADAAALTADPYVVFTPQLDDETIIRVCLKQSWIYIPEIF